MHIVFLGYHLYQLHAHDTGKDGRRNGQHHRFGQVLQHIENAAVPRRRQRQAASRPGSLLMCDKEVIEV